MLMVITYDVSTQTKDGRRRLRQVSEACLNYGQRVQNSVFECEVDTQQWAELRHELLALVNLEEDSLRFYRLGRNWRRRVEHFGVKPSVDFSEPLIV